MLPTESIVSSAYKQAVSDRGGRCQFQPWFWVTPPLTHPPPYRTRWQSRGPASYTRKVRAQRWEESMTKGAGTLTLGCQRNSNEEDRESFHSAHVIRKFKETVWNSIMFSFLTEVIRLFSFFFSITLSVQASRKLLNKWVFQKLTEILATVFCRHLYVIQHSHEVCIYVSANFWFVTW
jgi:hypothetical protein